MNLRKYYNILINVSLLIKILIYSKLKKKKEKNLCKCLQLPYKVKSVRVKYSRDPCRRGIFFSLSLTPFFFSG